jgi:heme-binding NEAT domain protein
MTHVFSISPKTKADRRITSLPKHTCRSSSATAINHDVPFRFTYARSAHAQHSSDFALAASNGVSVSATAPSVTTTASAGTQTMPSTAAPKQAIKFTHFVVFDQE